MSAISVNFAGIRYTESLENMPWDFNSKSMASLPSTLGLMAVFVSEIDQAAGGSDGLTASIPVTSRVWTTGTWLELLHFEKKEKIWNLKYIGWVSSILHRPITLLTTDSLCRKVKVNKMAAPVLDKQGDYLNFILIDLIHKVSMWKKQGSVKRLWQKE